MENLSYVRVKHNHAGVLLRREAIWFCSPVIKVILREQIVLIVIN